MLRDVRGRVAERRALGVRNGAAGGFCSASMRSSSPVTKRCALGNGASANTRCGARAAFALDASGDFDTAGSAARPQAISAPSALAAGSLRVNERGAPPRAGASAAGAGSARRAEETETGYAIGLAKGVHILEKGGSNGKGGGGGGCVGTRVGAGRQCQGAQRGGARPSTDRAPPRAARPNDADDIRSERRFGFRGFKPK
nr:hypothetical protein [Burkholderia mallei]